MKRSIVRLLLVCLALGMLLLQGTVTALAEGEPVELAVGTAADLEEVRSQIAAGKTVHVTLTDNLALENWTSLGTEEKPFTGTFDGGGHAITIKEGESFLGVVSQAEVENLIVMGKVLDCAALASYAKNTTFTDCGNAAWVINTESGRTCGLVGVSPTGNSYIRCYNTGIVQAFNVQSADDQPSEQDQVVCGIASDYLPTAEMDDTMVVNNQYKDCYNGGVLRGDWIHAIGEAGSGSSTTMGGCYSVVKSNTSSGDVTKVEVLPAYMAAGSPPANWDKDGNKKWTYTKGLYPYTAREEVTDGDIAATAAAWVEDRKLYLNAFDDGVWKTPDDTVIKDGAIVSLGQNIRFEYKGLSREVWLEGSGTVTAEVTDAAQLTGETKEQSVGYLETLNASLASNGIENGVWSILSESLPEGVCFYGTNGMLSGVVTARPGNYTLKFRCTDQNTRQYLYQTLTLQVEKATGGVTCTSDSVSKTYNGEGQALGEEYYTLAENAALEEILYQAGGDQEGTTVLPVNAGTYTVTVKTKGTDYYEASSVQCTLIIEPYPLTAEDFNREELMQSQPYTGEQIKPAVVAQPLTDCVTPQADRDYTVTYVNNGEPTYQEGDPARILIEPKGNYAAAGGQPLVIPFTIYVGGTEVRLESGRGYTLGTPGTSWTLNGEENKVTYTGGSLFYVKDQGAYHFARSA